MNQNTMCIFTFKYFNLLTPTLLEILILSNLVPLNHCYISNNCTFNFEVMLQEWNQNWDNMITSQTVWDTYIEKYYIIQKYTWQIENNILFQFDSAYIAILSRLDQLTRHIQIEITINKHKIWQARRALSCISTHTSYLSIKPCSCIIQYRVNQCITHLCKTQRHESHIVSTKHGMKEDLFYPIIKVCLE